MGSKVSKKITFTILSISLLTVMAGAAMAPALGVIRDHFANESSLTVQFIVSLPALFIIITNLFFSSICRYVKTKTLAIIGLAIYVVSGSGAFFIENITLLLCLRAVLGISVGLVMPLSTGLLSYYYPPEDQSRLMGLSAAMNQMGGVIATLLAGLLANISWNSAFLVYLLGLIALALVALYLPNEKLVSEKTHNDPRSLLRFHPSVVGMLLVMTLFFIYPTNFAITSHSGGLSSNAVTLIMVALDVIAFGVGMIFGKIMNIAPRAMKYIAPVGFLLGYALLSANASIAILIAGSVVIGFANGIGVPYLNTIASIKGGKNAATTVMPLISASLYLGQFISPIVVSPLASSFFPGDMFAPYKIGTIIAALYLLQSILTRKFQSIPPTPKKIE